jgi:hypothetical protein
MRHRGTSALFSDDRPFRWRGQQVQVACPNRDTRRCEARATPPCSDSPHRPRGLEGTKRAVALATLALLAACGSGSKGDPGEPQGGGTGGGPPGGAPGGPYTLKVKIAGDGQVTGGAIACGTACATTLASGTIAILTASSGAASLFTGWTGCDQDLGFSCQVSLTADREVGASFVPCASCAVAAPIGGAVQAGIGPAGGRLSSPGGALAMVVPADAVASTTTFSIQAVENRAPGGRGTAFELLPSGALAKPVTLTFGYSDFEALGAAPALLGIAYQGADGAWRRVPSTVDATARTIQASVDHFTIFSVVTSLRLNPAAASVASGGQQVFWLDECFETQLLSPPVSHFRCEGSGAPNIAGYTVLGWSVNGLPGGSAALGFIDSGTEAVALYTAPVTSLTPFTVTVGVRLREDATGMAYLLVAEVVIGDPYAIVGTLRLTGGAGYVGTVDVLQRSIFMTLPNAVVHIDRYEDQFRTCTYDPSTWGLPLLSSIFQPGASDVLGGTYALGGMYSSLLNTTETCTDRTTGEVKTGTYPYGHQIAWGGSGSQEFPGNLYRPNQAHSGEWVGPDGQGYAWSFMVVPRSGK